MYQNMDENQVRKLVESLIADLKSIHNESKKKFPAIREACEGGILKLRMIPTKLEDAKAALSESPELYRPLLMGCQSRNQKIVPTCLTSFQRLATCNCVGKSQAPSIVNQLDQLSDHGIEELRVLQSVIVILTTSQVVQQDALAKTVVLCFRLYFCHDATVSSTAAATIRQILSVIIDRMITEDQQHHANAEPSGTHYSKCPQTLLPRAQDAYLLFQDLCQLTNGDPPYWLHGMTEMTRTFGLELLESTLRYYPHAFLAHPEFSFLLKERVCPLIIKLFSPNIKYKQNGQTQPTIVEKPVFPVSMRLLRIVSVLIKQFYTLLVTECEIFLSLLVKFLGTDKPFWQRALALEVLHSLCVQPQILKSLCLYYDMQEQSTKVFHDICFALDGFIQSLFSKEPNTSLGSSPSMSAVGSPPAQVGTTVVEKIQTQSGFLYQGVWIPLTTLPPTGTSKALYLEQLDFKNDTPNVSETYGLTISFACILEIARGLDILVHASDSRRRVRTFVGKLGEDSSEDKGSILTEEPPSGDPNRPRLGAGATSVAKKMIEASSESMLSILTQLLDSSTDESITESILKSIQTYASVCGLLGFSADRDAFVSTICKASLPSNSSLLASLETQQKPHNQFDIQFAQGGLKRVPSLQSLTGGGSSSNLTTRNIQCMRAILSLAHCHGDILGSEWYIVLLTLQHLSIITGMKSSNSGNKSLQANEVQSTTMAPGVMAELPVLSAMLSRLFESSQYLDDVSLHHLVDALCRLSSEDMEQAISGKEPCLFSSSKLLQTGLFNLSRLKVLWKPLTAHLLEVAQHPHARLRELGGDALTTLIRSAITFDHATPLNKDFALQQMILNPLQEMASISFSDVRQQQYECVLQIVQRTAPQLQQAWPMVLQIVGSATNQQSESIIRQAFQSLQLVITDFLPIMPCWCLQVLIGVVGRFGLQPLEINISLTAVGLLWNLSDFLYQNRVALKHDLEQNLQDLEKVNTSKSPITKEEIPQWQFRNIPPFDSLWICMFSKLGELCVDPRPAVRKSAGQTLFSTINAHGGLLESNTWYTVLWKVLFPLLEKVKTMSSTAADVPPPSDTINIQGSILIHHTRDTAEKQWAETRVLTLAGVSRVFSTRKHVLRKLEEYPRAWALLLELLESGALSKNAEVALNSLKSLQEVVQDSNEFDKKDEKEAKDVKPMKGKSSSLTRINLKPVKFVTVEEEDLDHWIQAWRVWLKIGTVSMSQEHLIRTVRDPDGKFRTQTVFPSQGYLTALVLVFPCLLGRIFSRFGIGDLQRLCKILDKCISVPIHTDSSLYLLPVMQESGLSSLQQIVVHAVHTLREPVAQLQSTCLLDTNAYAMYPDVFRLLLRFIDSACNYPKPESGEKTDLSMNKKKMNEHIVQNYVPFAEKCLQILVDIYKACYVRETVINENILEDIIKTLHTPLKLKYACPSQSTWKLGIKSLIAVLQCGLPVIIGILEEGNSPKNYLSMWMELSATLEDFLFCNSPPPESQTLEQHKADEQIDIKLLFLIREEILPHSDSLPQEYVDRLMKLLNRGSIHSATSSAFDGDFVNFPMREEFARRCFETLLHFSFVKTSEGKESSSGVLSKLALGSLLQRCKDVLRKYSHDERLNGKFPLPRARMAEMLFAMKAVTALLSSLKETHSTTPEAVDRSMWQEVISMYPALLECITCRSDDVRVIVKDALMEFADMLSIPSKGELSHI